jgi:hypothetical protein
VGLQQAQRFAARGRGKPAGGRSGLTDAVDARVELYPGVLDGVVDVMAGQAA